MVQSQRSPNILEVLDGADFPATIVELVAYAEDKDASEDVLDLIQGMPDRNYNSIRDVSSSLCLLEDLPGHENLWSSEPSEDLPADGETSAITLEDRISSQQ